MGDVELELEPAAHALSGEDLVRNLGPHANAPPISSLLQGASLLEGDHHAGVKLFPHARHAGEDRGCNLAHVLGNGFWVFNKVELGAGIQRKVLAAHALGDVAQRQKAHALVGLVLRHQCVVAPNRVDQPGVQMHGTLGLAGGAGGVHQNGQVLGLDGRHALFQFTCMLCQIDFSQIPQGIQADDVGVIQIAQTFHVKHDDFPQARQLVAHLQGLVELLVVFHEQYGGAGVFTQVLHLAGGIGGVNAVGHATAGQHGNVGPHPLNHGVGQNGGAFAFGKAQAHQATGNLTHGLCGLIPGFGAPKPQVLLAHPDVWPALFHGVPEHGRNGFARHHDVKIGLDAA